MIRTRNIFIIFLIKRFQNSSHTREVPYSRLVDSSPTSTFPPTKLDSDSRLNTLGSILSVPENGEYEGTPKSSISDSKLSVDYFNTTIAQSLNSEKNEAEVHIFSNLLKNNYLKFFRVFILFFYDKRINFIDVNN